VTPKRALIVDDSKSARVVLSRLLEKHDLTVDMRDSAEAALQYLRDNRPDVIFMDHVMSGMDGLSAVQAIKNDPSTASIPIMMYTSQDGELYAGEARAIGAAGVLAKQMAPGDIAAVLMQLQVLPDRRDGAPRDLPLTTVPAGFDQVQLPAAEPGGGAIVGIVVPSLPASAEPSPAAGAAAPPPPSLTAADVRAIVEPLLQEQGIDLRRFVVASLDGVGGRVVTEVGERVQRAVAELNATIVKATAPVPVPEPPPPPRAVGWIALAAVALVAALGFGVLAWQQHAEIAVLKSAPPPAAVTSGAATGAATGVATGDGAPDAPSAAASPATPARASGPPSQRAPMAYGDAPFSPARIAALGAWLSGLERRGFTGVVRVTVVAGEYCLTGNPTEGYTPAPADMPANRCDLVGNSAYDALRENPAEPPALVAIIAGVRERSHGAIDVRVDYASRSGSQGYPSAADSNAGQWNAVAATHSYLEFAADARPTS
jgi:CheY-like chemotaxis protein